MSKLARYRLFPRVEVSCFCRRQLFDESLGGIDMKVKTNIKAGSEDPITIKGG
jgi:hypothetical protein